MKLLRYYSIILLILVVALSSCTKELDLPLDGRITMDEVFKDRNATRGWLNTCYNYGAGLTYWASVRGDEAEDANVSTGGGIITWYLGAVTAQNYAAYSFDADPWANLFEGIDKCNVFLQNIPNYSGLIFNQYEVEGWTAQAHTLRALYYLMLIKRYGDVPLFDKPLGTTHDFSKDKKEKFSKIANFIIDDCRKALAAPESEAFSWNVYDNQFNMMNRAVAYAIMSEVAVYAASPLWSDGTFTWAQAAEINKEALGQLLANDYKLYDVDPGPTIAQNAYAYYFFTEPNDKRTSDKETILCRSGRMSVWRDSGLPSTPGMTSAGACPSQELVDAYEMANGQPAILGYKDEKHLQPIINEASGYDPNNPYEGRDPRFYASIYYNGAVRYLDQPNGYKVESFVGGKDEISEVSVRNSRTGYYLRKFNNYKSRQNSENDGWIRMFRLGQVYLNFAEAAYQAYGPDEKISLPNGTSMSARDAVNAIRQRAGMPDLPMGMAKDEFEKRYRNERRIELAFEQHRFFDVRRWKILATTDKQVTGMRITKEEDKLKYTRFTFDARGCSTDKFLKYPINQTEVDKIFGFTGEDWQNEGW